MAEHQSPDNNNYMAGEYSDFMSHSNDNNTQTHNNRSKLNDTNNNSNSVYSDYQRSSYDDQMEDKTNLGLNNNDEDFYKEEEDRRYEEEFDSEYAQNSNTMSKQFIHKQDAYEEDAHQLDEFMNGKNKMMLNGEQKTIDDEYLDEFDEDGMLRRKSDMSCLMKKQESLIEDDPELKHLEETQQLKSQQQQFQDMGHSNELDQFDIEIKQKKSVTIDEDITVHEKPREKRTAKQRWHWAYNRIVHQQQVSAY